jgi:hypothetical protein
MTRPATSPLRAAVAVLVAVDLALYVDLALKTGATLSGAA